MLRSRRFVAPAVMVLASLAAAVALAACGSGDESDTSPSGSSGDLTPVDFQLSWLPGGENMAFFVCDDIYASHGIDINVKHSNDPTLSIKLIASGERPMGIAYTGDIVFSAAKGSDVTSLYTLTDRSPFGLVALGDSDIQTPEDLVGKTVGVTSLPTDQAYFYNMLKEAGVDKSQVDVVDPGQSGVQQVIQGNLDATSALVEYEPVILDSKGYTDHTFMPYADYGAPDAPFYDIAANPDWLSENPEVAKNFIAATRECFDWTSANTEEAAQEFTKQFPDTDPELAAQLWTAERAVGGDGSHDPQDYADLEKFFLANGLIDKHVDVTKLYTDEYLPEQG